jgi:hypothetical protein
MINYIKIILKFDVLIIFLILNQKKMGKGLLDIKNQDTFLGGQNVHNLIIIGLLAYVAFVKLK